MGNTCWVIIASLVNFLLYMSIFCLLCAVLFLSSVICHVLPAVCHTGFVYICVICHFPVPGYFLIFSFLSFCVVQSNDSGVYSVYIPYTVCVMCACVVSVV